MARLPRLTVPGLPHHIIQRGNNRERIFADDEDRRLFLALLREQAVAHRLAVHAYVLMDNHVHLLATPDDASGVPRAMQAIGRRYVQAFNRRHGRTGTLWEGRYRSTLVQSDRYLLACMAYIDLNPVRAGLVDRPANHPWSSHAHYVGLRHDLLVSPHALYWALGNTPFAREAAYRDLVEQGVARDTLRALTDATLKGWALGDAGFLADLRDRAPRRPERAARGRPTRTDAR